jgi:hypothetical protein
MATRRWSRVMTMLVPFALMCLAGAASAVEVSDLKGFEDLFGRYAPGGDCRRTPQVVVDVAGFTFEVDGRQEVVTNPEYAAAYGPHDYSGISQWFFPFRIKDGYPVLMTFNHDEKKGVLAIDPQDQGYPGGPKLSARHQALVSGSPYARCK